MLSVFDVLKIIVGIVGCFCLYWECVISFLC